MDPQNFGASVPALELDDLKSDTDEMENLAKNDKHLEHQDRLLDALRDWLKLTDDPAVNPSNFA